MSFWGPNFDGILLLQRGESRTADIMGSISLSTEVWFMEEGITGIALSCFQLMGDHVLCVQKIEKQDLFLLQSQTRIYSERRGDRERSST